MIKATAVTAGLILAIGALSLTRSAEATDSLFHGVTTNTASEQRQDFWWKDAYQEVSQNAGSRISSYDPFPSIIVRGNPSEKVVALTFDDGPHPGKVEELLKILKTLQVKATFFVVGKMVEKHPELVQMEAADGHEIADHSFSHVNLSKISEAEVETEYLACKNLIKHVTGAAPRFCRPPGGQATPAVMEAAKRLGLTTVMWTDDPKDYANPGSDVIGERTLDHLSNGGVLLLHEGVDETMDILPTIVESLRSQGYRFVTLSELAETLPRKGLGSVASLTPGSSR